MGWNAVGVRSLGEGAQWRHAIRGKPIAAVQHVRAACEWAWFAGLGIDTIIFLGWSSALGGWV